MICEECGKEFFEDWRKDKRARKTPCRFCSRSCSNTQHHSNETKEKIKESLNNTFILSGISREKKFCKTCGKEVSHNNKSGYCHSCKKPALSNAESVQNWRKRKKIILAETKGSKCQICGYDKCINALEFHHLDPTKKDFGISHKNIRSIEAYKEEIKKCILVCSNCHKEIHAGLIDLEELNFA